MSNVHPIFQPILDRFSQGLADPADAKVMAICPGCGGEIYEGETVYVVNGTILHEDSSCVRNYIQPDVMSIEQALGVE
jgi:hypothetical protein